MSSGFIHIVAGGRISFPFKADNLPVCAHPILLTCSPVSRPVGCSHLSDVVSAAAADTGVGWLFKIPFLICLDAYPQMGFLGPMINLF